MIPDPDIFHAAELLIDKHGGDVANWPRGPSNMLGMRSHP